MKDFISDLVIKALVALELPFDKQYLQDKELKKCIQSYGMAKLSKRRESSMLLTFLTLMLCPNEYNEALCNLKSMASEFGYKSVKARQPSTVKSYRSEICHNLLFLEEEDLPNYFHEWKDKTIAELNGKT